MTFSYELHSEQELLTLTITGISTLAAAKRTFSIPFRHIKLPIIYSPEEAEKVCVGPHIGTRVPRSYKSGTFWALHQYEPVQKTFYHMINPTRTIIINLKHQKYSRLILEIPKHKPNARIEAEKMTVQINDYLP